MKRVSSMILMLAVYFVGALSLALFVFFLPSVAKEMGEIAAERMPQLVSAKYLFLVCSYAAYIPFFYALYQILKFFSYIDNYEAFSENSLRAVKYIKYCTTTMCVLFVTGGMPAAYIAAEAEDAPGIILVAFAFACSPLIIAALAAAIQRLLQQGIDMKNT